MFACDSCLRRTLLSLTSPSTSSPRLALQSFDRAINPTITFSRSHTSFESLRQGHHRHSAFKLLNRKNGAKHAVAPFRDKPASARAKFNARNAEAVENNRQRRLEPEARGKYMQRAMRQESKFLVDPLKLAQNVIEKLRDHQLEEALELVRVSEKANEGKGVDSIVSWNHIVDWLMREEAPGEAWKVYNEMKKRGHKPDSHTYTIMLRGYRQNVKKPNAVQQAISVYDSISAANSTVTVTTIHTNALLSVCARAHDIDALWKITGRLPERGPGAPDHVTFTTILQALNSEAQKRAIELGAREGPGFNPQSIFDQLIEDARKLWLDITARWRKGLLHVDETLVCAMGRLLMLSDDKETQKDVLNLVHQTMKMPRMPDSSSTETRDDAQQPEEVSSYEQRPSTIDARARLPIRTEQTAGQLSTMNSVYATPGSNTLSMLIETATALRELKLGKFYWELLTEEHGPYRVVPDHQNIMAYLRLLRVSRASKAVLELLRETRSEEVNHKLMVRGTFVIAMSTCLRDRRNPNVFETASRILDLMQASTEDPFGNTNEEDLGGQKLRFSPKVLRMYLEVAITTTKGINGEPLAKTRKGDLDFERDPTKNPTLRALRRLGPEVVNVRQLIKSYLIEIEQQAAMEERTIRIQKLLEKRRITPHSTNENIEDLVELLRTMIGAIDKIILVNEKLEDDGMGPLDKEILSECWLQKRKLAAFVSKYANATVEPRSLSEVRARRVDERGHRLPSRGQRQQIEGAESEESTQDLNLDEETSDPTMPAPNPRSQILSEIQTAQEKVLKKTEERGLSRKQRIELIKKETIRAQFPASMLRQKELSRRNYQKEEKRQLRRDAREGSRGAAQEILSGGDEQKKVPVWKAKQLEHKLFKAENKRMKDAEKEERRTQREWTQRERGERRTETYRGWGQGFEELAKQKGRTGFVELGP